MASQNIGEKRRSSASDMLAGRRGPKTHTPWREAYKERCRQRLKKRRFEMMFRQGLSAELHTAVQDDADLFDESNESFHEMGEGPLPRRSSPHADEDSPLFPDANGSSGVAAAMTTGSATASGGWLDGVAMDARHMVCEAMTAEWSAGAGDLGLPAIPDDRLPFRTTGHQQTEEASPDIDELCSLMEELEEEMRAEEAVILERYREHQASADRDLCTALESLSTEDLLCPLCERNYLLQNGSVIFCQCGLRVDTEQDGINLQSMRKQLQLVTDQHGLQCSVKPQFALQSLDGRADVQNLLLVCDSCDHFSIVL